MAESSNKNLVLAAMIFAVAMTFIDQTIVSISVPEIQKDLKLSDTGVQWIVNGYLLSLSALFALGGRISDILGHRRMVIIGILIFTTASALCGATPVGGASEAWIIAFRVIQGAGAAIMFPAALAIVIAAFPIDQRGRALAIFFGITGGLTSVGPLAGGYLSEWTWRSIFWINVPVAIIALILTFKSKPSNVKRPAPMDYRGAVLVAAGMGLVVLGLQQASLWGWSDPKTIGSIVVGALLLIGFVAFEARQAHPLINVRIFKDRAFASENLMLFLLSIPFVPMFLFASMYAQISLGYDASNTGLFLLVFFGGFAWAAQIGGRILDQRGARPTVVLGAALGAVGFFLWARHMTDFSLGDQWIFIALSGAGIGLMLGPASTDAVNRAPNTSYGEATGITQTVRNFAASLGVAVLGTILISQNRSNIESSLGEMGIPKEKADEIANSLSQSGGGDASAGFGAHAGEKAKEVFEAVQLDFAMANRTIFYVMAGVLAVAFVLALITVPRGKMEEVVADPGDASATPGAGAGTPPGAA